MRELTAEIVHPAAAALAESPRWDARDGTLAWVDILRGVVHRLDPATGRDDETVLGPTVGALAPARGGGFVLALRLGFGLLAADGTLDYLGDVETAPGTRMNDGACDPAGRFWAGSITSDERTPAASLYRLDPDLRTTKVLDGITVSNGLGWSPDATRMYYADSPTRGVDVLDFDVDEATVRHRRRLVDVAGGFPDGMAVDADGCLWVAVWGGGQVRRYTPDGVLDAAVVVPASQVTSCCFGGPDLDELFITTAARGLDEAAREAQPLAGGIFSCTPGVAGLPTGVFAR